MLFIRELVEEMCHKIDIHDPVATGQQLDKLSLEAFAIEKGGGQAAVETVRVWTRVMLGKCSSLLANAGR